MHNDRTVKQTNGQYQDRRANGQMENIRTYEQTIEQYQDGRANKKTMIGFQKWTMPCNWMNPSYLSPNQMWRESLESRLLLSPCLCFVCLFLCEYLSMTFILSFFRSFFLCFSETEIAKDHGMKSELL